MPKATSATLRANVANVASLVDKLAASLEVHQGEIEFHCGSRLTLDRLMVRASTIRDGKAPPLDGWLPEGKDKYGRAYPTLPEFVRALAKELRPTHRSRKSVRPTKISDRNAERTYMVRELSRFVNIGLGDPRFDLVAATVNTILDERDNPLDANHARKLASDLF